MEIYSSNWSTSFFYKQDLRSLYMNGILNSTLQPGIYNSNMFLYAAPKPADGTSRGGLNLYIRKNTTFIFSNRYILKNGVYERDLSDVGSYLIKSTVLSDVDISLIPFFPQGNAPDDVENILGTARTPAAPSFYIAAVMEYDEDSESRSYTTPQFKCIVKNPAYGIEEEENSKYFFLTRENSSSPDYLIPDGLDSLTTSEKQISYLILGEVIDTNYTSTTRYVVDNGGSSGQDWIPGGDTAWVRNHIFVGRGFPEYRREFTSNKDTRSPGLILDHTSEKDTLYVDIPSISTENLIFKKEVDWKDIAKIGPYGSSSTSNYLSYDFSTDTSLASDLNNFTGSGVIADIFFLSTRARYSDYNGTDIINIFSNLNSTSEFVKGLKLLHFRWISNCAFTNLNPKVADEVGTTIPVGYITSDAGAPSNKIVPLDISSVNRDRLISLLENRNVIPAVINYLRQNNLLSPEDETSLVPAFVVFRKFDDNKNFVDDASSTTKINPANILSFFDLQYKTSKINNININAQDVYTVIPVME